LYEDECHFYQQTGKCRTWTPPEEKDPVYLQVPGRYSVSVFGAVNPKDGMLYAMLAEKFNTNTLKEFLSMLMEKVRVPFSMVLDNSKPHRSEELKKWASTLEDRIRLIFLPPYSPHLNKIERVWKLTRKTTTHNKYYATLDYLKEALNDQFKLWKTPNQTLKKLCEN
jgi:transposase